MSDYFLTYLLKNGICAGRVENWTVIFDLNNVGASEIPKDHLKGVVRGMSANYRGRLYRFFSIHVNWLVRGLWKVAHKFVDEFTNRKLRIFGHNDYQQELHETCEPENLEVKYGGTLPNKEADFWPPQWN